MRTSWSKQCVTGYEIKVTRSDFLRDDKWVHYLDYCNQLWFVTAPGVCEPNEVPESAGLLVASKAGRKLMTRKKAPYRDIEIPDSVFRYILMWRVKVVREHAQRDNAGYWRNWLKEKREKADLGWNVSKRIRELVSERITKVEQENSRLKGQNENLAKIKAVCDELGVELGYSWDMRMKVEQAVARHNGGELIGTIDQTIRGLEKMKSGLASVAPAK